MICIYRYATTQPFALCIPHSSELQLQTACASTLSNIALHTTCLPALGSASAHLSVMYFMSLRLVGVRSALSTPCAATATHRFNTQAPSLFLPQHLCTCPLAQRVHAMQPRHILYLDQFAFCSCTFLCLLSLSRSGSSLHILPGTVNCYDGTFILKRRWNFYQEAEKAVGNSLP